MYKIGIIGAGKVGISVGRYLNDTDGYEISGYFSRSEESANYASKVTNSQIFKNLKQLVDNCNIIFISTPDDIISSIWSDISIYNLDGKVICHFSGSLSSEIFFDISSKNAYGCSLHPMLAISSKENSYKDLKDAFFTIEGDGKAVEIVEKIMISKSNNYKVLESKDKSMYHAASVFLSNFVISLGEISVKLLGKYGLDEKEALHALSSLSKNNLENMLSKGIKNALTGPVERNDIDTVKRHLYSFDDINLEQIYSLLSLNLIKIASEKNPSRDYSELENLLREERLKF